MNYLKEYNISDEQIETIKEVLKNRKISTDTFVFCSDKVKTILNMLRDIGVTNFYDVIVTSPSLFLDTIKSIQMRIDNYENKEELARLINEDAGNLFLADLM